ncbi:hypothetical protein EN873_38930 [bacterium M00.F.Ca.ET.230.01.1.1]|nr:hypothetical protein EN873_38930 [bacterium M00.F.Ca.ET.230.01.1.1]
MHPIGHLFQDIYRNYWGITPGREQPERRREPPMRTRKRRASCELSGGCPFGPDRGDWSYHASASIGGSE